MSLPSYNRRRGSDTERRAARALGGTIHHGLAGDVDAAGFRVEVKLTRNLWGYGKLKQHIDQAIENGKKASLPWLLVFSGGKPYHNGEFFAVLPLADLKRLLDGFRDGASVVLPKERWDAVKHLVTRLHEEVNRS
jgi:hypothetical protein